MANQQQQQQQQEAFSNENGDITKYMEDNNCQNGMIQGENGAWMHTGGDKVLELWNCANRGQDTTKLRKNFRDIILEYKEFQKCNNEESCKEAFNTILKMIFQIRDCRGGKGERLITYQLALDLHDAVPGLMETSEVLSLFAEFGYYKDYINIWELACARGYDRYATLINAIIQFLTKQRLDDIAFDKLSKEEQGDKTMSQCGKWVPSSEKCKKLWIMKDGKKVYGVRAMAEASYGLGTTYNYSSRSRCLREYRKGNTRLRYVIACPEPHMCSGKFDMDFNKIPSKSMTKNRNAIANTGKNPSESVDRIACAARFHKFILEGNSVKGGQLTPDELIYALVNEKDEFSKLVLLAQYTNLELSVAVDVLKKILEEFYGGNSHSLCQLIPHTMCMSDVSDSMMGNPMRVSIALAILLSKLAHLVIDLSIDFCEVMGLENKYDNANYKASASYRELIDNFEGDVDTFRVEAMKLEKKNYLNNVVMSFTDRPFIYKFTDEMSLLDKHDLMMSHVGYGTNFELAVQCLLDVCVENGIPSETVPKLLVITDNQFNQHVGWQDRWNASHENVVSQWVRAGFRSIPSFVYWNVSTYQGHVAKDDAKGVQFLSGYSPTMVKSLIDGDSVEQFTETVIVDGLEVEVTKSSVTPIDTLFATLNAPRYDIVANAIERFYGCEVFPERIVIEDEVVIEDPEDGADDGW